MSSIEKAIERLSKAKEKKLEAGDEVIGSGAGKSDDESAFSSEDLTSEKMLKESESPQWDKRDDFNHASSESNDHPNNTVQSEFELDLKKLSEIGYLTPDSNNKSLSEEYRAIKRPVLMNAFGKGAAPVERGNLIAITSSLPGEGKSYTSLNLALSIATELDSTVLIIDGDILKPQLSTLLGLEKNRGLTDVLHEPNTDISDVLISTQIPKFKIIPAGRKYENSTELLASEAMENLVIELGNRYKDRIVLFDSPPLLATSESTVLNHLMGQILLVVESGKTPVDAVKESLTQIHNDKVVGLVLNKTNGHIGHGGYGTYGGYGAYG